MHQVPGAQVYSLSPDGARISLWAQLSRTATLQGRASSSVSAPSPLEKTSAAASHRGEMLTQDKTSPVPAGNL